MKTVADLLRSKGGEIWSTTPDTLVYDALREMADKNVGALLVVEGDKLVGVFSERDYARKVILEGRSSRSMRVSEIMTARVLCVRPDQSLEDCMQLMTDKRFRHLPVLENGRLVGVISIGDVVKGIITEQQSTIHELEEYIIGRR